MEANRQASFDSELCQVRDMLLSFPGVELEGNGLHLKIRGRSLSFWILDEWRSYYRMLCGLVENFVKENQLDVDLDADFVKREFVWISPSLWNKNRAVLKGFSEFVAWRMQARYFSTLPAFWRISLNRVKTLASYFENEDQLKKALYDFDEEMGVHRLNEATKGISFAPTYSGKDYYELFDNLLMDGAIKEPLDAFMGISEDSFKEKLLFCCR